MIDSDNLLRFDLFQQLVDWLYISIRDYRKGRQFLEASPLLMEIETDKELERLIIAQVEEEIEVKQQMQHMQALLGNARHRGGTPAAIREAYINTYGGLVLDLPSWLVEAEQQRMKLVRLHRPDRTSKNQITLLRTMLTRARRHPNVAIEIIAELQNELAHTLLQAPHPPAHADYIQILEQAREYHQAALQVYTFERYPYQYAKTSIQLGIVHQHYGIATGQQESIELALACFKAAPWVYSSDTFPEQWATVQTHLGNVYALRSQGKTHENLEYAIYCHEQALHMVPQTSFPAVWATAQINLGDAYRQRIIGAQVDNIKQAMLCYRQALQVFTRKEFPREWASIHSRLASIFQQTQGGEIDMDADMNLRCAIVCYEGVLEVYSLDSFPVEHAATLVSLGNVHHKRCEGNRHDNLAQALSCYQAALQVFTEQAFPTEYQQIQRNIHETML